MSRVGAGHWERFADETMSAVREGLNQDPPPLSLRCACRQRARIDFTQRER